MAEKHHKHLMYFRPANITCLTAADCRVCLIKHCIQSVIFCLLAYSEFTYYLSIFLDKELQKTVQLRIGN